MAHFSLRCLLQYQAQKILRKKQKNLHSGARTGGPQWRFRRKKKRVPHSCLLEPSGGSGGQDHQPQTQRHSTATGAAPDCVMIHPSSADCRASMAGRRARGGAALLAGSLLPCRSASSVARFFACSCPHKTHGAVHDPVCSWAATPARSLLAPRRLMLSCQSHAGVRRKRRSSLVGDRVVSCSTHSLISRLAASIDNFSSSSSSSSCLSWQPDAQPPHRSCIGRLLPREADSALSTI
jgi:hypothetical protein